MNPRSRLWIPAVCAAALACGPDVQPVTVTVQAPNARGEVVPIEGAELTILPFDIDSLYAALEERNQPGPEPVTDSLEVLYQGFSAADAALIAADSALTQSQMELEALEDRASEEYRAAFRSFEQAQARRESAAVARDSAEAIYAPAREAYNRARGTWESSAWDGFAEENEDLYAAVEAPRDTAGGELPFVQRTGPGGSFKVWLTPGSWWVAGRTAVPGAVRQVYRWNHGFTVGDEPVAVALSGEGAEIIDTY
ncbi:MAG: hypothetical protein ABR599_02635 [Gemmatimonadota bacterium]